MSKEMNIFHSAQDRQTVPNTWNDDNDWCC
jgi:hypothetical protein